MTTTVEQIDRWLAEKEHERLEFKEAKNNFHFEKLVEYCAALSNEGGGSIVLGVTDKLPRQVVGTTAFDDLERTKAGLIERLHLRIECDEVLHPKGRVLVFTAPRRPLGMPIQYKGAYWMRAGEDLVAMTQDQLKRIFDETGPDFSAEICPAATMADLSPEAIEAFRQRWHSRSKQDAILKRTSEQLLRDAELVTDRGVTYAALVLLGSRAALGRHLPQAEVVFEYRSSEAAGPASQREEFREGFLLFYDRLWDLVNLRNDKQHYQEGLFMIEVPTFNEGAIREAVLNAVAHRDYRLAGSVFIRQFPRRIEVVSPGGLPDGVTPDNILDRQSPRNRRVADALGRCGLVERAGQGADRIFESCIREGKGLPEFTNTDAWQVSLTLHGALRDPRLVRFLERVTQDTNLAFNTHELVVLDLIHQEQPISPAMRDRLPRLVEAGIVEAVGRGRGARYILSRRFHAALGQRGGYTRRKGLDRRTSKELLVKHLVDVGDTGSPMSELQQVLPGQSRAQIKRLLDELKRERRARLEGERRWARWFAVRRGRHPKPEGSPSHSEPKEPKK